MKGGEYDEHGWWHIQISAGDAHAAIERRRKLDMKFKRHHFDPEKSHARWLHITMCEAFRVWARNEKLKAKKLDRVKPPHYNLEGELYGLQISKRHTDKILPSYGVQISAPNHIAPVHYWCFGMYICEHGAEKWGGDLVILGAIDKPSFRKVWTIHDDTNPVVNDWYTLKPGHSVATCAVHDLTYMDKLKRFYRSEPPKVVVTDPIRSVPVVVQESFFE